jgi:hypothetical protein
MKFRSFNHFDRPSLLSKRQLDIVANESVSDRFLVYCKIQQSFGCIGHCLKERSALLEFEVERILLQYSDQFH